MDKESRNILFKIIYSVPNCSFLYSVGFFYSICFFVLTFVTCHFTSAIKEDANAAAKQTKFLKVVTEEVG